ncbi:hypothetical protein TIFTF001_017305 [Ficus carica]|uniref:Uncharacterized protein n=1 Tax=Ficus carica TaxID=3494 RepID=A0AA88DJ04_FICCA|nr:hypothetical protein TIFTF001_017305 [Ficus carica]
MDHGYRPPPSSALTKSAKAATPPSSLAIVVVFARGCGAATKKRERERCWIGWVVVSESVMARVARQRTEVEGERRRQGL